MNINRQGILYIVATPIGNLQDMTLRAIEVLKTVGCIVAEDTRHSQPLLQHFSIKTKMIALHEHNERERAERVIQMLMNGDSIALISDAGTPLISDPGFHVVRAAQAAGVRVVPVPGAVAAITALSVSGLPTDRFVFEGFLPVKANARLQRLQTLESETRTIIFYEAPHRILECLEAIFEVFEDREVVIARELTKMFETIKSGHLSEILEWMRADEKQQLGEFVVIVGGKKKSNTEEEQDLERILKILLAELSLKQAVDLTAKITQQKKNEIYDLALELKKS